jgi:hypothetical protein
MKTLKYLAAGLLLVGSSQATTIAAGGGTAAGNFFTSTGVALTGANSTVQIGSLVGDLFTRFAAADVSPMALGTTAPFLGKVTGNYSDNTAAASAFNGLVIWYRVESLVPGATGVAFFGAPAVGTSVPATATLFPVNGNGAADTLNADTRNLTLFNATLSTAETRGWQVGDNRLIVGAIPEPSAALLGLLGVVGLIRRRR